MKYDDFDLDAELRSALRRVDPPPNFAARVLARTHPSWWERSRGLLAIAAGIILLMSIPIGLAEYQIRQRQAEAQNAKSGLVQALRITSAKLRHTQKLLRKTSL